MQDHQNDSDSSNDSMDPPPSFTPPSAPPRPAEQQLDLDPRVATRIMDELKKISRGGCLMFVLVVLLLLVIIHQHNTIIHQQKTIIHQQNTIKEQEDHSTMLKFGSIIIKAVQMLIDPTGYLGAFLSTINLFVDMVGK